MSSLILNQFIRKKDYIFFIVFETKMFIKSFIVYLETFLEMDKVEKYFFILF